MPRVPATPIRSLHCVVALTLAVPAIAQESYAERIQSFETSPGFVTLHRAQATGAVWLTVRELDREFLYVDSLPSGVGSNDIGLDRGKLGRTRLCGWHRAGTKLLMIERNLDHRADDAPTPERRAVDEGFARSVVHAFEIAAEQDGDLLVDATSFCVRDAFGVASTLDRSGQGSHSLDAARSFVDLVNCRSFPSNTELTATLTFEGPGTGSELRAVTPSADSVTVQARHSLIALPEAGYEPLPHRPGSGFMFVEYQDYAAPVAGPMTRRWVRRHRLVDGEPLVYHVDSGVPEPVRSALVDGASWWADAFAAAGFPGVFRVELLPPDADPMDVRYNVIQWVHRSSRGWSYGDSIADPRTGEILKGHVSLGSRRVRQDFLIAQALTGPDPAGCEAMALARLRQLAAHEVGHTLGLVHNFAASGDGRASVMDYPHPKLGLTDGGGIDLSDAYAVGIGAWDEVTIRWGYGRSTASDRATLLRDAAARGLRFASDADARATGSMHPRAHLWDNGDDPIAELLHLREVRRVAFVRFGPSILHPGDAPERLDELLTPLYLLHRYQLEAVAKIVGGVDYAVGSAGAQPVGENRQRDAVVALLDCLTPEALDIPERIVDAIPPRTWGARRSRELLPSLRGGVFDPIASGTTLARSILRLLLHPERVERVGVGAMIDAVAAATLGAARVADPRLLAIQRSVDHVALDEFIRLAYDDSASEPVRAAVRSQLAQTRFDFAEKRRDEASSRHLDGLLLRCGPTVLDPARRPSRERASLPPGSPIGCGEACCAGANQRL